VRGAIPLPWGGMDQYERQRMENLKFTRFRIAGSIGIIWLDRPPLNLLREDMKDELLAILENMAADDRVGIVIVTGSGEKAFCAGRDLAESHSWQTSSNPPLEEVWDRGNRLIDNILYHPKITIAALNGATLGGGCELTLPFDLVIAEKGGRIGIPEASRGVFPGTGAMQLLPKKIGIFRAKEMVFWGKVITAEEALSWGLVNVVTEGKALDAAYDYAGRLDKISLRAIGRAKEIMNRHERWADASTLHFEKREFSRIFLQPDAREGINAFFEKRPPFFNKTQKEEGEER